MKFILVSAIALSLVACGNGSQPTTKEAAPAIAFDINSIAGKTPKEVMALLGSPDAGKEERVSVGPCKTLPCERHHYQQGRLEIVFVDNKADWITINNIDSLPLNREAIRALGLPASEPTFENPDNVVRWEAVNDIQEVSAFSNGQGGVEHFYVHCATTL